LRNVAAVVIERFERISSVFSPVRRREEVSDQKLKYFRLFSEPTAEENRDGSVAMGPDAIRGRLSEIENFLVLVQIKDENWTKYESNLSKNFSYMNTDIDIDINPPIIAHWFPSLDDDDFCFHRIHPSNNMSTTANRPHPSAACKVCVEMTTSTLVGQLPPVEKKKKMRAVVSSGGNCDVDEFPLPHRKKQEEKYWRLESHVCDYFCSIARHSGHSPSNIARNRHSSGGDGEGKKKKKNHKKLLRPSIGAPDFDDDPYFRRVCKGMRTEKKWFPDDDNGGACPHRICLPSNIARNKDEEPRHNVRRRDPSKG
jgi:hypothetical protein